LNKIKERRTELGITQEVLAAKIGLTQSNISRIESEEVQPSLKIARAISAELNCSVDELFGVEDDEGRV